MNSHDIELPPLPPLHIAPSVEPFFDDLIADRQRRGISNDCEPVSKIDPNPPQLSVVWHDSPESVDRAMWEQAAIEAGVTYEELIEGSNVGETEDGEVFEFTHEQAIDGMRTQGCWGFVDTKTNTINAWAADDVDASTVLHMLAHEIGHVTGTPHDDYMQEEMRAEQFGRVAALAYKLWLERNESAKHYEATPVAWREWDGEHREWDYYDEVSGLPAGSRRADMQPLYTNPQHLSVSDIPAEPVVDDFPVKGKVYGPLGWIANTTNTERGGSEYGVSTTQALITLGKVIAGYQPGEEGWTEYDQQAYDAAMSVPQPLSNSDIFSNSVKHDLYKTGDKDAPEQIRDRNGEVVLDCCKRCGKFESQLSEPCVAEPVGFVTISAGVPHASVWMTKALSPGKHTIYLEA